MAGSKFEELEAVHIGIQMEKNGHKFYADAMAHTPDETGKQMFARLARDEIFHLHWLASVRKSLIETGKFGDIERLLQERPPSKLDELPDFPIQALMLEITAETRELDALEMGIQAEIATAEFYANAAGRTQDTAGAGKELFQRLAEWEKDHRRLLEAEHDYLEKNGFYLGMAEFQLEGPD